MSYLLDTNIISEVRKATPHPHVATWWSGVAFNEVFLSPIVIGEVRQGISQLEHRNDLEQAARLEVWLDKLKRDYQSQIVPLSIEVLERWGRLNVPDRLPAVDGLLAATALVFDLTLVTRNTRDIQRTGVKLLNPFES